MTKAFFTLVFLAFLTLLVYPIPSLGQQTENHQYVPVEQYGLWSTARVIDNFDGKEKAYAAYYLPGNKEGLIFLASIEKHNMLFISANLLLPNNPFPWSNDAPMSVLVRVDDGLTIATQGRYPNVLMGGGDFVVSGTFSAFLDGKEARIRTEYGTEQHTYIFPLDGFADAVRWVYGELEKHDPRGSSLGDQD